MSNRLLIPRYLRSPHLILPSRASLPGIVPASPGNGSAVVALVPPVRTMLLGDWTYGNDGSSVSIFLTLAPAAGTMIVADFARNGFGDIDAVGGSDVTNNKGLTFVKQSAVASFMTYESKWSRIERWWAYTAVALTGLAVSITWFRTGTSNTAQVLGCAYTYTNIPKANGGSPFYSNGGANPATAINSANTNTTMTATVDPRGIAQSVCVATSLHRDSTGIPATVGAGMNLVSSYGPNGGGGSQSTCVTEDRINSSPAGSTQVCAFVGVYNSWLVLGDVIDAT